MISIYYVSMNKKIYSALPHWEDLLVFNRNKKKIGWTQSDNTETTIPRYNFMFFYVFKMAMAIAFHRENAEEAI